jgi:hypothetical protein
VRAVLPIDLERYMVTTAKILFICAACSLAGCSSNRGDPLAPGGAMSPGAGRANLAVNEDNKYLACQQIFEQVFDSYIRAEYVVGFLSKPGSSARIIGTDNGNATVRAINRDSTGSGWLVFPNLAISYIHFSETGKLYLNGTVNVNGAWKELSGEYVPKEMVLDGTVLFSGDFSGSITFSGFGLGVDDNGRLVDLPTRVANGPTYSIPMIGLVTIISKQNTIEFIPYLFDWQ